MQLQSQSSEREYVQLAYTLIVFIATTLFTGIQVYIYVKSIYLENQKVRVQLEEIAVNHLSRLSKLYMTSNIRV